MKILAHVHTLNDEEVVDRTLAALAGQTHPIPEILIVDNGSTDGTLDRVFPENVTLIRHGRNLGTSGSVITGFQYGLDHGYDWVWVFDADTAPRPDALEKLVEFIEGLSDEEWARTLLVASLPVDETSGSPYHGLRFTPSGFKAVTPRPGEVVYTFDGTIWTGCLYNLAAVAAIGLPNADYYLDWGEYAYGYHGKRAGFTSYMHTGSIVDHNTGGAPALRVDTCRWGPFCFRVRHLAPFRCYYTVRNIIYFWFHEYHDRSFRARLFCLLKMGKLTASFMLRPFSHGPQARACVRGFFDGLFKRLDRRY